MGAPSVDLRHLRYFLAVAEAGHVGRAARRLHLAQPALSRQIRDLEADLRVELLSRGPKGVTLTPSGAALRDGAAHLLEAIALAVDRAVESSQGRRGGVVLSVGHALAWDLSGRILDAVRHRAPNIELSMVQSSAGPDQWAALRSGAVDLFIGLEPIAALRREFDWSTVRTEPLGFALVARDHPLAGRSAVGPEDLSPHPFLWIHSSLHPDLTARVFSELKRLRITSPIEEIATGPLSLWMLVAAGRGWTLMSRIVATYPPHDTLAIPVPGVRAVIRAVIATRNHEDRPAVLRVRDIVLADIAEPAYRSQPPAVEPRGTAFRREPGTVPLNLELRHLRAAQAIVQQGSLGRGAQALGVSQPALSRQLRELEREIGAPLVTRTTHGVSPSPTAILLGQDCGVLLERVVELVALVSRAGRGTRGSCVIGSVTTAPASALLGAVVRACAVEHPDIHLTVEDLASPHQVRALRNGAIDLGISHAGVSRAARDVQAARLSEDAITAALLAESHALAARRQIEGAELATIPFLFMSPQFQPQFRAQVMRALGRVGLVPRVDQTYDGIQTSWRLAAEGRGWTLGFESHRRQPPAGLVAVPITGLRIPIGLVLSWRRSERNPVVLTVRDMLRRRPPRT